MRIRQPFAAAFVGLVFAAAYFGLAPVNIPYSEYHSDKVLHFLVFFLITVSFYWILETTRRRVLHLTLIVCTLGLSVGSEILQDLLPNGREFDYLDIVANVAGSLIAVWLSATYHRRMLDRKRAARGYTNVSGEEGPVAEDIELGEGPGPQQTGIKQDDRPDLDAELDNWDENAEDAWDEEEPSDKVAATTRKKSDSGLNGGTPIDVGGKRDE